MVAAWVVVAAEECVDKLKRNRVNTNKTEESPPTTVPILV